MFSVVTILTLLIVSANVANLMLGRAVNRQREIAVRRSLGCSHFRIVRMLVAEGLVVAGLAWIASLAFAWVVAGLLARAIPPPQGAGAGFAEWFMRPDWNVAAYAMILAGLATVACVLGPVVYAWRQPLTPSLKAGEHSVIRGRSRLSRGLVVLQLSLSVLLVAIAGLAWRSLAAGDAVDIGFRPDNILIATVSTVGRVEDRQARAQLLEEVRDRLHAVPGVTVVSYADNAPREGRWSRQPVRADASSEPTSAEINRVAPDFLAAHGLKLVAGQDISRTSQPGRVTALINQQLAETLWPGSSPLGRRVLVGEDQARQAEVVGVVPNAFFSGFRREARPNFVLFSAVDDPASGAGDSWLHRGSGFLRPLQRPPGSRHVWRSRGAWSHGYRHAHRDVDDDGLAARDDCGASANVDKPAGRVRPRRVADRHTWTVLGGALRYATAGPRNRRPARARRVAAAHSVVGHS